MDTSSPIPMVRAFLPKLPLVYKTAIGHSLGLTQNSKQWDLRTEVTVKLIRSFILDSPAQTISKTQTLSKKGLAPRGRMWISRVTFPAPEEDDIKLALFKAIEGLRHPDDEPGGYLEPPLLPVEAEWTGYRASASKLAAEPKMPEKQKYEEMMKEVTNPTTILYFHGGAYYLMDPATHRSGVKKLCKITKGRCLSVRYRLAPQNPFPSALLDALVSYLTLLYPPPGSLHTAVPPQHIAFAGDSAGGNLSMVLLQTLLEFQRQGLTIMWNGAEHTIPLPAGVATASPWMDITHSSPSCDTNRAYDYLPSRSAHPRGMTFPACEIWPASPPRKNIYAEDPVLCHPLVSPLSAKDWRGSCPVYVSTGQELLSDEGKIVACRIAGQGVKVVFEEFEAMPHVFAFVLEGMPVSRRMLKGWGGFMRDVTIGGVEGIEPYGVLVRARTLREERVVVEELSKEDEGVVLERMRKRVRDMSEEQPDSLAKL